MTLVVEGVRLGIAAYDRNRLVAFLQEGAGLPFVWGERDCALWACDWIKTKCGSDPALALRGRYRTRRGCTRLLAREGGLLALASRLAKEAGLPETNDPEPGDVGCIEVPDGTVVLAVKALGDRWAMKNEEGLILSASVKLLRAWAV